MASMKQKYTHGFFCYGMPIDFKVEIKCDHGIAEEGKRKKYCRMCLRSAVAAFKGFILAQLKEAGLE